MAEKSPRIAHASKKMAITQLFEKIDRSYQRILKEYEFSEEYSEISLNAYLYLKKINSLDNPTMSELAEAMEVSKPSASNMVSKMAEKGLVETRASSNLTSRIK